MTEYHNRINVEMTPSFFHLFHHSPPSPAPAGHPRSRGFSLVEVLVSAAILGIAVVAIVAMVRQGGDLQTSNGCRQMAHAALAAQFETGYGHEKFNVIPASLEDDTTIFIGVRWGGDSLSGNLHTTVTSATLTDLEPDIPVKQVTLTLSWECFEGERDTISFTKWVTE